MRVMSMFEENEDKYKLFYHGSYCEINKPDLKDTRQRVDFGAGFYLTEDVHIADKWAASKSEAIRNVYQLNFEGLRVYQINDDNEWFDYVIANRMGDTVPSKFSDYDVIIGKIADDRLFNAIEDYANGDLSKENAIKIIASMDYGLQIVLKTERAINQLKFIESKILHGFELANVKQQVIEDRNKGSQLYRNLKKRLLGGTYYVPTRNK